MTNHIDSRLADQTWVDIPIVSCSSAEAAQAVNHFACYIYSRRCEYVFVRIIRANELANSPLSVSVVLLTSASFCVALFYVIRVFCLLVVLVRLSVPVQVIDWKDSST